MILPNKRTNLDNSTLIIASRIIQQIKKSKNSRIKVNKLINKLSKDTQIESLNDILGPLNFLYLLNAIDYDVENDEMELINNDN